MPPSIGDLRVKSSIRYFEQHVQAFDKHTYSTFDKHTYSTVYP